jgi:formylglycine-generating enzyme required for sulfatase activity
MRGQIRGANRYGSGAGIVRAALAVCALALGLAGGPALAQTLTLQTDRGTFGVPINDITLQFWVEDDYGIPIALGDPDLAVDLYVAASRVQAIAETDFAALAASLHQIYDWSSSAEAANALGMADDRALRRALAGLAERTVTAATGGTSLADQAPAAAAEALAAIPEGNPTRAQFLTGIAQVAATRDLVNLYLFDRASLLNAISTGTPVSPQLIDRLYAQRALIETTAHLGPHTALLAGLGGSDDFWRVLVDAEGRAGLATLQALAGDSLQGAAGGAATPAALQAVTADLYRQIEAARAASRLPAGELEREMALFNLAEMDVVTGAAAVASLETSASAQTPDPAPRPEATTEEPPAEEPAVAAEEAAPEQSVAEEPAVPEPATPGRFRDCGGCPEMVVVPAGSFAMGSSPSQPGFDFDEWPQHAVEVGRFAIGRFEVTFAEWDACVAAGACSLVPEDEGWGRGDRPVVNIGWYDIQDYLDWLSRRTGHRYRLPSEAEWEYAARARTDTTYWWGDATGGGEANCAGCGSEWDGRMTAPVGSFPPNGFGLYDMLGNVTEWVADAYRPNYLNAPKNGSTWSAVTIEYFVGRGGSWYSTPLNIRAANRQFAWPWLMEADFGFRVARSL